MLACERKAIDWAERHAIWLFAGVVSVLAALIRLNGLDVRSADYDAWLRPWYDTIKEMGGLAAVSRQVGDYNVLYQLIIALMTYLPFHSLTLYKGLSVLFDYLIAGCAAAIVYELSGEKGRAALAYAAMLLLPSVFINSAYWAQCDSIYSFFLLLALYCFLTKRDFRAFLCVAVAFQFKLQAIFFLPFMLCLYVRSKRFSLANFLVIPLMSVVICLCCGRRPFETYEIYAAQANTYLRMSVNFPNIWYLISDDYAVFHNAAILLTAAVLGAGLLLMIRRRMTFDAQNMFNTAIWSVFTCVMFLPAMHERYGYPLVLLLVIAAVLNPRMSGYAVAAEVLTLISYAWFLWSGSQAAKTPKYICSMAFVALYVSFMVQCFALQKRWLPPRKDDGKRT